MGPICKVYEAKLILAVDSVPSLYTIAFKNKIVSQDAGCFLELPSTPMFS